MDSLGLLKLSGDFCKLAELDFLSDKERESYFDSRYIQNLIDKTNDGFYKLKNFKSFIDNAFDNLYDISTSVKNQLAGGIEKNRLEYMINIYYSMSKIISSFFESVYFTMDLENLPTYAEIDNIITRFSIGGFGSLLLKGEGKSVETINVMKNAMTYFGNIANIQNKIVSMYYSVNEKQNVINTCIHNLSIYYKISKDLQQILHLFKINGFRGYFEQIDLEITGSISHLKSYSENKKTIKQENKSQKEFDKWVENKISNLQLAGEYPDIENLTWEDLDEEDKLMILENYNLK